MGIKLLKLYKRAGVFVTLIIELVIFSMLSPLFLTSTNIINLLRQITMMGIASLGVTFVMLGGAGADLSVAGQIPTVIMIVGILLKNTSLPPLVIMLIALVCGAFLGFVNGMVIRALKINPFVVTLGTMTIFSGIALMFTNGITISGFPDSFRWLGQGYVGIIPVPVIVMVAAFAIGYFVLEKTYFGRSIYAMGGNSSAARLAGINVERTRVIIFTISGVCAALTALLISSRTMSASPSSGSSYAFDCMTCCVLGGISFGGGEGKLWGTVCGALMIGSLNNAMVLLNVGEFWQNIIKGCILIAALLLDRKQRELSVE